MRHIIPISGKDSLATAIVQTTMHPELCYEYIYNDTYAELPETYDWLNSVEKKMGFSIQRIGKSLKDVIYEQGMPELFEQAERIEMDMAGDRRESPFFWIGQEFPLSKIRDNKELFFEKRVNAVSKMILEHQQKDLFTDALVDGMELAQKSCGLFCGK